MIEKLSVHKVEEKDKNPSQPPWLARQASLAIVY